MATTTTNATGNGSAGRVAPLPHTWTASIANHFFQKGETYEDANDNNKKKTKWHCKVHELTGGKVSCGTGPLKVPVSGGYTPLKNHLKTHKGFDPDACWAAAQGGGGTMDTFVVRVLPDKMTEALFLYLRAVIMGDYSFRFVEDLNVRALADKGLPHVSRRSLMRTEEALATVLEEKIAAELQAVDWIGVTYDQWENTLVGY